MSIACKIFKGSIKRGVSSGPEHVSKAKEHNPGSRPMLVHFLYRVLQIYQLQMTLISSVKLNSLVGADSCPTRLNGRQVSDLHPG